MADDEKEGAGAAEPTEPDAEELGGMTEEEVNALADDLEDVLDELEELHERVSLIEELHLETGEHDRSRDDERADSEPEPERDERAAEASAEADIAPEPSHIYWRHRTRRI